MLPHITSTFTADASAGEVARATATNIPLSFFETKYCNTPMPDWRTGTPMEGEVSWANLVRWFQHANKGSYERKEDQYLFCPTIFRGTRAKANATTAGIIVIDVDKGVYDEAVSVLREEKLEALLYTSASSRPGTERFRVVLPLADQVDTSKPVDGIKDTAYTVIWRSAVKMLGSGEGIDDTKRGAESMFYMPGAYAGAENRIDHIQGDILSAGDWIDRFDPELIPVDPPRDPVDASSLCRFDVGTLYDSPIVRREWIDEYNALSQHHIGRISFLNKVAMSAVAQGYQIAASDLEGLFSQLDPFRYKRDRRDIPGECSKAVDWGNSHASPSPSAEKRTTAADLPDDYGGLDEFDAILAGSGTLTEILSAPTPRLIDRRTLRPYLMETMDDRAFEFLAAHCVQIGQGWYIKLPDGGWKWENKETSARSALWRAYGGDHKGFAILPPHDEPNLDNAAKKRKVPGTIDRFFGNYGGCLSFAGTIVAPGLNDDFVEFLGNPYLNIWRDNRLGYSPDCLARAEPLLRLIRENLCDLPAAPIEDMLAELHSDRSSLFRWVVQWLAANYVNPGQHLGTALWFCGSTAGFGKGLLGRIMRELIGPRWVNLADSGEIEANWTTFMTDGVLIFGDEFQSGDKYDLAIFFKKVIRNDIYSGRSRYVGSAKQYNSANWILATNSEDPIHVEPADTRHCLIRTASDSNKVKLAQYVGALLDSGDDQPLRGLAAIFANLSIDYTQLRTAYMTPFKQELINTALSSPAIVRWFVDTDEQWVIAEHDTSGDLSKCRVSGMEAWNRFRDWREKNAKEDKLGSGAFWRKLARLTIDGRPVVKKLENDSQHATYEKIGYALASTYDAIAGRQKLSLQRTLSDEVIDKIASSTVNRVCEEIDWPIR
jgi:hypothetical protein